MGDKIAVAVWGLGRAGVGQHVREIQRYGDLFRIVGCYDVVADRMQSVAERTGSRCYRSSREMLDDPSVELVSVVTRHADHVDHGIAVLDAGKALFIEKPLALSYDEALRLKEAAERNPGKLYCRHNRRFLAEYRTIREIIDSGVLGEIAEARLSEEWYRRRRDWQTLSAAGGGLLSNWGPHLIDQGLQIVGAPVASVWATLSNRASMGDADDCFRVILRGTNDRVVYLNASDAAAIPDPFAVVYGTTGMAITSEDRNAVRVRYIDRQRTGDQLPVSEGTPPIDLPYLDEGIVWKEEGIPVDRRQGDWHDSYRYLHDDLRGIRQFPVRNEDAFEVVRITDLVRRSCGQTVSAL